MRTVPLSDGITIRTVWFDERTLFVGLSDGRTVGTPIAWYPRLANASSSARQNWRLIAEGEGVHWPEVDEDLSLEGMLAGRAAPGGQI
jgi:hypothetical protein